MAINLSFKRIFLLDELCHGIPWDGMGRSVNPMGWDGMEKFVFEIPWDGMGRPVNPMGRFFRPIPSH
jgi:hypothetical protein